MHDQLGGRAGGPPASRARDHRWPVVGRAGDLDRIRRTLTEHPTGLLLVGDIGVGKSTLLTAFADRLVDEGWFVSRHQASEARSGMPFSPFVSLLDGTRGIDDPLERLFAATAALRADEGTAVLTVDDAQWLDPESLAFVQHVGDTTDVAIVLSVTLGHAQTNPLLAFGRGLRLGRVDVEPLRRDEVMALLGAVFPDLALFEARRLWELSRGNPLYLHELVRQDGEPRRTERHDEPSLTDVVGERLGELSAVERVVLELVAVGGQVSLSLLDGRGGAATVAGLERRGLLAVEQSGRRLIGRLGHPVYGQVLTGEMGPARVRARRGELLDDLRRRHGRRRTDQLSLAVWGLDQGDPVDPDLLVAIARRLVAFFGSGTARDGEAYPDGLLPLPGGHSATAARLARAASDDGGGFAAARCWFDIERHLDPSSVATAEALARMTQDATTDDERTLVAASHLETGLLTGDGHGSTVTDLEVLAAGSADPAVQDHVRATRSLVLYLLGHLDAAVVQGRAVLASAGADVDDRHLAAAAVIAGLMGSGRAVQAISVMERPLAPEGASPDRYRLGTVVLAQVSALAAAGRLAEADALAVAVVDGAERRGVAEEAALFRLGRAEIFLVRGRPGDALHEAAGALAGAGLPGSPFDVAVQAAALCTLAHAQRGQAAEAAASLSRVDGWPATGPFALAPARARAWAAVVAGRRGEAMAGLEELAHVATEQRHVAMVALHDLVRLGEPGAGSRMVRLVDDGVEGAYWAAAAAHGWAFDEGDGHGLDDASTALAGLGATLVAAESAAQAADAHRAAGRRREAAASRQAALALAARCQGARTPALATLASGGLTPGELAVARLAAGGASNKAIAAELHLSVRTTETYLRRVYAKLGVSARHELGGHPEL